MSDANTLSTVNHDGFTEDDVAARRAAINGNAHPNDELITNVRQAYRAGYSNYRVLLGVPNRAVERRKIERRLTAAFPTSDVICEYAEDYHLGLNIVVTFPT